MSKLSNITEKAVFTLEDFYCVLQEAFRNRRIESVSNNSLNESDLRKKAHFVIGLSLMKRTQSKQLIEVAKLNFVELCGSEQAVAEDSYYQSQSVRSFVTKSFNGLSSLILKSALKKRDPSHQPTEGDVKLVSSIRQTLTHNSNIVLVCNINPSVGAFEHSLPAIKFCSRIRESIAKKHKQSQARQSRDQFKRQDHHQPHYEIQQDQPDYRSQNENYNSINSRASEDWQQSNLQTEI